MQRIFFMDGKIGHSATGIGQRLAGTQAARRRRLVNSGKYEGIVDLANNGNRRIAGPPGRAPGQASGVTLQPVGGKIGEPQAEDALRRLCARRHRLAHGNSAHGYSTPP